MNGKIEVSVPHEAVRYFIKRFNSRSVFTDTNVICPSILAPTSPIGAKLASLMRIKHKNKDGNIDIDCDEFNNIGHDDLKIILRLCYLEFSLNQNEKHQTNTFDYITRVYKEVLQLLQT
jgi:hypothetical protein